MRRISRLPATRTGSERTGAALRARAVRRLEETAAELWSFVPVTFPDGTSFPARRAFDEAVALGRAVIYASPPRAADLMRFCLKALAGLASVGDPHTYTVQAGIDAMAARTLLRQSGMAAWEQTLTRVLLLTVEYHRKAGHLPVAHRLPEGGSGPAPQRPAS
ncbi:hypothetical protein [Kitasatospora sp. NPDC088346]|uniref:hypothetical protein n=1 Tax=Kitasatospora sp. NPDC088346 TaxID=3364073 RepID=UPI0037FE106E